MNATLEYLLKTKQLTRIELASLLFPEVQHPTDALRYVIQGKRELKESELSILHDLANATSAGTWRILFTGKDMLLVNGLYRFYIRGYKSAATKMCIDMLNKGLVKQITLSKHTPIYDLINALQKEIDNFKTK